MPKRNVSQLICTVTAAALLLSSVPLAAWQQPTNRIDSETESSSVAAELAVVAEEAAEERLRTDATVRPVADLTEVRTAWRRAEAMQEGGAASEPMEKKGAVRWLKKRWWVPVLAAVVLGTVLIDDDDNDAGETDDD